MLELIGRSVKAIHHIRRQDITESCTRRSAKCEIYLPVDGPLHHNENQIYTIITFPRNFYYWEEG